MVTGLLGGLGGLLGAALRVLGASSPTEVVGVRAERPAALPVAPALAPAAEPSPSPAPADDPDAPCEVHHHVPAAGLWCLLERAAVHARNGDAAAAAADRVMGEIEIECIEEAS